jgi:methylthioribose-1-phosphate isomerase
MIDPVRWSSSGQSPLPGALRLIEQTLLPEELVYIDLVDVPAVWQAIKRLAVRGAPAIGIAAAYGLLVGAQSRESDSVADFLAACQTDADYLAGSRPTAVNLAWALRRCMRRLQAEAAAGADVPALKRALYDEATAILDEDIAMCRSIGEHGVALIRPEMGILTHCNAGGLATGDYGTALSPIYPAQERGLSPQVYADETRPLLQGARLTAWELQRAGVDVTVICDSMAAQVMREGRIDLIITGADRIAANGDSANKIGTYMLAVLAKHHGIPFYIAAPYSTIDPDLPDGSGIPIEERAPDEIRHGFGRRTAPADVATYNPAFDVTPAELIHGIITERGILRPPYTAAIADLLGDRPS